MAQSFPDAVERRSTPRRSSSSSTPSPRVGGSQFLDSPAIGDYHTYLCDELVPFVDAQFPTLADRGTAASRESRPAATARWSRRCSAPTCSAALATHAGDALFEVCYARDFAPAARALRDEYGGSYDAFWADFRSGRPILDKPSDEVLVNTYAMAAAYSADARRVASSCRSTSRRPSSCPTSGRAGSRCDPARLAREEEHRRRCANCGIWIDAGGTTSTTSTSAPTAFRQAVVAAGIADDVVHFELFAGTHRGLTWRYPLALAFLVDRLSSTL